MPFRPPLILCLATMLLSTRPATAQTAATPTDATPVVTLDNDPVGTAVINSDPTFDWIRLSSGEWLKGRIESMLDESLEFDSDELDSQTMDWSDVDFLYSPKLNGIRTEDKVTDYGTLLINGDAVTVISGVTNTYQRSSVLGIAPGGPRESNYWSGEVSIGLTLRQGNVDQTDYTASASFRRITPRTRFSFDYLGSISEIEGVKNANNHRVTSSFDIFLSRRMFVRVPFAEYYRDPFVNIDYRITAGAAVGYDIVDTSKVEWHASAGPAYQWIRYESVQAGQEVRQAHPVGRAETTFEWDVTSDLDLTLNYSATVGPKSSGGVAQHFMAKLEYELSKHLDLETSFIADSVSDPQPDSTGAVPEKTDIKIVFGVGLDF